MSGTDERYGIGRTSVRIIVPSRREDGAIVDTTLRRARRALRDFRDLLSTIFAVLPTASEMSTETEGS